MNKIFSTAQLQIIIQRKGGYGTILPLQVILQVCTHLVEADRDRAQSGTPRGMSQSESAPSGNNLTSADNSLGMNLSKGSTILGNTTSTKIPKIGRGRYNRIAPELLLIIASNYVAPDQHGQK